MRRARALGSMLAVAFTLLAGGCPADISCPSGVITSALECSCPQDDAGVCGANAGPDETGLGNDAGRGSHPIDDPSRTTPRPADLDAAVVDAATDIFVRLQLDSGTAPLPSAMPDKPVDIEPLIPALEPAATATQSEPLASACGRQCATGACDEQGRCLECTGDEHCKEAGRARCESNRCVACRTSSDCAGGGTCEKYECRSPPQPSCPDGSPPAASGTCTPPPTPVTTNKGPTCGDGAFDRSEECEIGFGGTPPNVYDETNCDPKTCKRIYWQPCDPAAKTNTCPANASCSYGGNRAFCVPRACSKQDRDCVGEFAALPEQCPRMPLYTVQNFSTLCFMLCAEPGNRCPRGLECRAGVCLFPAGPGVISVTRDRGF